MITIRDVASRAKVSIATVSRVVNGNRPVHPDIRKRVLKAVEELDYRPNFLARGLRQSNTYIIGLIIPDSINPFYAEVARSIENAGFAAGYSVILCNSDLSVEKQQAYLDVLISHKVDGIILIDNEHVIPSGLERIQEERIPVVHLNSDNFIPFLDQIMVDNYQGGFLAGNYLLGLMHRHIGCINLVHSHGGESPRVTGFRQALTEGGVALNPEVFAFGNGRYESGYQAIQDLLRRCPYLTAVFFYNDLMALGAINALRMQGIRVPEDISIIGFDNVFYAAAFVPPLTTIAQPITAIGQESIARLLERIQQPDKETAHVTLPVELIERSSCRRL